MKSKSIQRTRATLRRAVALRGAACAAAAVALAACHTGRGAAATSSSTATSSTAAAARASAPRLLRDVEHLASDALEGRGTGTPGNDSAAAYVARRFADLGLDAVVELTGDSAGCAGARLVLRAEAGDRAIDRSRCRSYLQPFTARSAAAAHAGQPAGLRTQNVVAVLRGTDPALRGQFVVIGAHVDHLGRDASASTDRAAGDAIRNGADDNASGTAAVMELARLFAARPPRRSMIFVAFSGEELGLLGSQWFVEHAPVPVDSMVAMLNFDMVGRLTNDRLLVYGVATAAELPAIVESANAGPRLAVRALGDGFGPSDHSSFYAKEVPVLHFFTDLHADYHSATDDVDKVNGPGMARVVDLAHAVAREIADRPAPLTYRRAPASQRAVGPGEASGAPRPWLGSVPDMASDAATGLRLTAVTPGSPGDQAGLRAGDVVTAIGGTPVKDLYSYTDALYAHKPGDRVTVEVVRDGRPLKVTVTLGKRGQ
jgi:hypothetical protein